MKAYLAKGYGMDAGLVFTPKAVEARTNARMEALKATPWMQEAKE